MGTPRPHVDATVSVAIPVYNGAEQLAETIASVLEQSIPITEVRVLDNASTDGSAAIARSLLPGSSVIVHPTNIGAAENFRVAADSAARTDYFLWLAVGDRIHPEFVERCIETLERNPNAPACLTGVRFIDSSGIEIGTQTDVCLASEDPTTRLRSFLRRPRWTEFYCLYRRSSLARSPGAVPGYGSDVILTWWFLLRSPLAVTTDLLLDYRIETPKSVDDVDRSLDPHASRTYWHLWRLWKALRAMTRDQDIDPRVARVARRELILALVHTDWIVHLGADVANRWPVLRRPGLVVKKRLRN